jgi:UDP-N-acetylmuramyl tripeptide synthase
MTFYLAFYLAKIVSFVSKLLRVGTGSTWPGHILLEIKPSIVKKLLQKFHGRIVLVTGTNGKTTTVKMITTILGAGKCITNHSGANLLNSLASALVNNSNWRAEIKAEYAIFEVDEATLPQAIVDYHPQVIVCLNLFRDQLDRYGEVDIIADKWGKALRNLPEKSIIILNADDPQVANCGENIRAKVLYFGIENKNLYKKQMDYATDSTFCPYCGTRLTYEGNFFSHLGHWSCPKCGLHRPNPDFYLFTSPLPGIYMQYNTLAAVLTANTLGVGKKDISRRLSEFTPAFGRQEESIVNGRKVKIILSKNPTGFNQSLDVLNYLPGKKKNILLVLNDLIPDGRDISWIWDVDFEKLIPMIKNLTISGLRAYDIAVRIKYAVPNQKSKICPELAEGFKIQNYPPSPAVAGFGGAGNSKFKIFENLKYAIDYALKETQPNETLYVLPTYSAMLEVRKILMGRKIL